MQYSTKRHTAIFGKESYKLHYGLFSVASLKKIAVLCFHTAKVDCIEPTTKLEFKRVRNHTSNQTHAITDNLLTWSIIHLFKCILFAQVPALYQDVSNLS
jgi:hypothetical protein